MHKKVSPDTTRVREYIMGISRFPHCDPRILHAPGECKFCDMHPDWQGLRAVWGIAFTGYEPDAKELPCPADNARPHAVHQAWGPNQPKPA